MSLRRSLTLTPALLEAARRNGKKSRGPRTARGKAHSRLNALQDGRHSRLRWMIREALLYAPPFQFGTLVRKILTPEMAWHPVLREEVEMAIEAEHQVTDSFNLMKAWREKKDRGEPPCFQSNREC
jgi:hypothetical protein